MSPKRRARPPLSFPDLRPDLKPLLQPVVEPVIYRLDRHEELLEDLRDSMAVQFKRTAAIQAQLDQLLAQLSKKRR